MKYFVTGATGFIGKRLVRRLLRRRGAIVYFLMRDASTERLKALYDFWGVDRRRAIPIAGDLTREHLGIKASDRRALAGKIDHLFHLAAVYDLKADAASQVAVNVDGTRRVVELANLLRVGTLHHVSSIAAAGLYRGVFRETMFAEAEALEHPYFATKHDSERIVREQAEVPVRIYRPGIVVGDSKTGEIDKIDGPYYFFKLIQRVRDLLPAWMPTIGIEGGRINIVPVDFVVDAMIHIAHRRGLDGRCFHLVDPRPMRVGEVISTLADAAHAPTPTLRLNAALLGLVPSIVRRSLLSLGPVRRIRDAILDDLGLPAQIVDFLNYPTRFDCRETLRALEGSGIACPSLRDYAWVLWDYWERHLDPDLFVERSLRQEMAGKVVLITGGSSGIGLAAARKIAGAARATVICGRDRKKLAQAREVVAADGHRLHTYVADLADMEDCDRLVDRIIEEHGAIDVVVNNAGRSIRRGIEASFDRFHDVQRTMQLNYFGAVRTTMRALPHMLRQRSGHIVNISSIGVLTNAPRFSAYVASKAALDAWSRCAASEFADAGITFTTINMPLVRTPMIAPTKLYNNVPTLSPDEAGDLVVKAIVEKPVRIATGLGRFGEIVHTLTPRLAQVLMNTSFRMFPDSGAAGGRQGASRLSADQAAFQQLLRGIHF
ncbi:MAG: SDR family oxidoreductase [Burkholderiaceae bacterium]|nr:SDR family oxidoreductase [Burkholderiaceae bacterium]